MREQILEIAGKELEIDPGRPRDRRRRGRGQGRAAEEDPRPGRGRCGDLGVRRADHRRRRPAEAVRRDRRARDGQGRPAAPLGHLVRGLRRRGRGRRRDGRGAGDASRPVLRRRQGDQPDTGRGPDRGRRGAGSRARRARELLPVLPVSASTAAASSASYLAPGMEDLPKIDTIIIENPSADGPYGAKGIGEMANNPQPPAIATAVYDAIGVWVTELPITPERVLRALEAKAASRRREGQGRRLRRGALVAAVAHPDGPAGSSSRCRPERLRHLQRRPAVRVLGRRQHPRHRRRSGARLPRHVRARVRRRDCTRTSTRSR